MKINQATLDLIKRFEGLRLTSYKDAVGVWTIGYGTTSRAGIGVSVGAGMTITEKQAEDYLMLALQEFSRQITPHFTRKPNENQFGAMLSLAYNIGPGAFGKSTCLKRFNAGDDEGAAEALTWFNKAGGKKLRGLVRRREAEYELFMAGVDIVETPQADPERHPAQSKTGQGLLAAIAAFLMSNVDGVTRAISKYSEAFDISAQQLLTAVAVAGLAFVAMERVKKWQEGDR